MKTKPTSIRLTLDAIRLIALACQKLGISRTAFIELAIREKAKREGVK
jgi:uncharacterized protein (DUF1778 family)